MADIASGSLYMAAADKAAAAIEIIINEPNYTFRTTHTTGSGEADRPTRKVWLGSEQKGACHEREYS